MRAEADDDGFRDGEGKRELEPPDGAFAEGRLHGERAVHALDFLFHDIEADAATSDAGDFGGCGKAGCVEDFEDFFRRKFRHVGGDEAARFGASEDFRGIYAEPVVAEGDDDLV